jgi:hypothetical protein
MLPPVWHAEAQRRHVLPYARQRHAGARGFSMPHSQDVRYGARTLQTAGTETGRYGSRLVAEGSPKVPNTRTFNTAPPATRHRARPSAAKSLIYVARKH